MSATSAGLQSLLGDVGSFARTSGQSASETVAPGTSVRALGEQVTDVLLVPLTNALNCWVPADDTLELVGDTEMPTLPVEGLFTVRLNVLSERLEAESVTSTRT